MFLTNIFKILKNTSWVILSHGSAVPHVKHKLVLSTIAIKAVLYELVNKYNPLKKSEIDVSESKFKVQIMAKPIKVNKKLCFNCLHYQLLHYKRAVTNC